MPCATGDCLSHCIINEISSRSEQTACTCNKVLKCSDVSSWSPGAQQHKHLNSALQSDTNRMQKQLKQQRSVGVQAIAVILFHS